MGQVPTRPPQGNDNGAGVVLSRRQLAAAAAGVAAVCTLVGFGLGYMAFGRHKPVDPVPPQKDTEVAALEALKAAYEPVVHELNDRGQVSVLKLEGSHVDDAALDEVAKFTALRDLSLRNASVSDAGIAKLRDLRRLAALGITDTRVTDAGLASLAKLPSLRYVWVLESPRLTPAGVEALRRALPGINVYVMNRPKPPAPATAPPKG